jgi:transcriptional regulator with XRE-family HTH domain
MSSAPLSLQRLGRRVRKQRHEQSLTLEELAHLLDMDPSHLARFERGERALAIVKAIKLAHILKIDAGDLFKGL